MSGKTVENGARRKRTLWRASHRGIKEMDIILGGFAERRLEALTEEQLARFEALLEVPDQQFLAWMTGTEPVPQAQRCPLLEEILKFRP